MMKKIALLTFILTNFISAGFSQTTEKFDIVSFKTPSGWKKEVKSDAVVFATQDASKGAICLMMLFKSIPAGNNSKDNFSKSWDAIFKDVLTEAKAGELQMQPTATEKGWNIESGMAQYENEGSKGIAMLVSATGGGKVVNLFILTNSEAYQTDIMSFIESIVLPKAEQNNPTTVQTNSVSQNPKQSGYKYNRTPFDDGWTAVEEEDWVRVTKGSVTVFLHYPKQGTIFPGNPDVVTNAAWNILVAPRYSNLKNYKTISPSQDYDRPDLAFGYLTDKQTKSQVFVVLFRKGGSNWFEIVTPDKNTFVQEFGFDPDQVVWDTDTRIFNKLVSMPSYNRFAVAASDFSGTWISNSSAIQQMYFANTGNYAGMNMNQSSQEFVFSNNSYNWKIVSVNGMAGNSVASQAKSSGTFTVLNDWQVRFSDIEGKPKKYNAYFSCIKGARLLHVNDADASGSGIFTVFARTK